MRISTPRRTGARFRPRDLPAVDAAEFVRAAVGQRNPGFEIEFVVAAPAEQVQRVIGSYATIADDAGAARVHMHSDNLDWPAMAIAVCNADVTVVSPPELVDHVRTWAATLDRVTRS